MEFITASTPDPGARPAVSPLLWLALLNTVLHGVGLVAAQFGMGPGTALKSVPDRVAYLATSPFGWTFGWATWMLCALALVAYLARLARHLDASPTLATLMVALAAAGAAADLSCDTVYIVLLPELARNAATGLPLFLAVERVCFAIGLVTANGFYGLATLLATIALHREGLVSRAVTALGFAVSLAAFVMVHAGFVGSALLAAIATGPAILGFCLWTYAVPHQLLKLEPIHSASESGLRSPP